MHQNNEIEVGSVHTILLAHFRVSALWDVQLALWSGRNAYRWRIKSWGCWDHARIMQAQKENWVNPDGVMKQEMIIRGSPCQQDDRVHGEILGSPELRTEAGVHNDSEIH